MPYPIEFFRLSYEYARRISQVTDLPLPEALLKYTNLYLRFGLERDFNPQAPLWQSYLQGLGASADPVAWTYDFYLETDRRQHAAVGNGNSSASHNGFGCFTYSLWPGQRVRLHFHNADRMEVSPLNISRMPARLMELTEMFKHIRTAAPEAQTVVGGSWLYNLESYRRLFPPAFLATTQPSYEDFPFLALWGQFLDHFCNVRPQFEDQFMQAIQAAQTLPQLERCFPFTMLRLEGDIRAFYAFYKTE
jgi:hypothetical protein